MKWTAFGEYIVLIAIEHNLLFSDFLYIHLETKSIYHLKKTSLKEN